MLECVVNVSEGRSKPVLDRLCGAVAGSLLDLHSDPDHHRSVLTLGGAGAEQAARDLTALAVSLLDLSSHAGAHPRLGVVDVVPFVPLEGSTMADAIEARNGFAGWAAATLDLPCFLYEPERSLPQVRRQAWRGLEPDTGPGRPHPTAGAACVGARPLLVAYNVWLKGGDVALARQIAAELRGPGVRSLGLQLGEHAQVSFNLVDPLEVGPAAVYDAVAARAPVERAELVGLVPAAVLAMTPRHRWGELDLGETRTIEARLAGAAATSKAPSAATPEPAAEDPPPGGRRPA